MQDLACESLPNEIAYDFSIPQPLFYSLTNSPVDLKKNLPDESDQTIINYKELKSFDEACSNNSLESRRKLQCSSPIPCRICLLNTLEELICPCKCKGSVMYVHQSCLKT